MINELWLNFPSKNLAKAKEFFQKVGFTLNEQQTNETMVCFEVGKNKTTVLFWDEETFKTFTKHAISETNRGTEILISIGAESREEIDETARKVFDAGGTIFGEPAEISGWMYGFGFTDLDGHRWNQVFMDFSKMPQA